MYKIGVLYFQPIYVFESRDEIIGVVDNIWTFGSILSLREK